MTEKESREQEFNSSAKLEKAGSSWTLNPGTGEGGYYLQRHPVSEEHLVFNLVQKKKFKSQILDIQD